MEKVTWCLLPTDSAAQFLKFTTVPTSLHNVELTSAVMFALVQQRIDDDEFMNEADQLPISHY
jgi:hypothetical protein